MRLGSASALTAAANILRADIERSSISLARCAKSAADNGDTVVTPVLAFTSTFVHPPAAQGSICFSTALVCNSVSFTAIWAEVPLIVERTPST